MSFIILIAILWFLSTVFDSGDKTRKKRTKHEKYNYLAHKALKERDRSLALEKQEAVAKKHKANIKKLPTVSNTPSPTASTLTHSSVEGPADNPPLVKRQLRTVVTIKEGRRTYESEMISTLRSYNVDRLWHMTHIDNISSILQKGLVSQERAVPIQRVDISDPDVQRLRSGKDPIFNRKLKAYSPTYITIRNPMLYRLKDESESICLLEIALESLDYHDVIFTDGNAASRETKFYSNPSDLQYLPWDVLNSEYWSDFISGKRKRCAEVLVYPSVGARHITKIHCNSKNTLNTLNKMCVDKATYSPSLFFG